MLDNITQLLNTLGLARRSGRLIIGQDHVFAQMKKNEDLLILLVNNSSKSVQRSVSAAVERKEAKLIILKNTDRETLGSNLGINSVQIVALPKQSGFAKKIIILNDRSDADE
ncbi:MAG: hypothetical protein GXZ18_05995 [Synergistaceae bacterium]|nr:hypothetical protein [Synergistaceae bacterium]